MELRPYQREALNRTLNRLTSADQALIVIPTGGGKTVVFAMLADAFAEDGQRTLILAHREELLQQAIDKVTRWTRLPVGLERADQKAGGESIIVGSVQTLCRRNRLEKWPGDTFGLLIVDEVHHVLATSYRTILDHFTKSAPTGAKVVGVTATPDRADGQGLGQIFPEVTFEYGLEEAIREGYLVDIRQHVVTVEGLDFSGVRTLAGDFKPDELEAILTAEVAVQRVADPIYSLSGDRPTLTFSVTIAHGRLLAAHINRRARAEGRSDKEARSLSGEDTREHRAATLAAFARGEFQHLVGCALFLEGFDEPRISCVAMARPTKSRTVYVQAVGRGTRLHPGKIDLLVLDFAGNAGRHKLVSAIDLFPTPPRAGDETIADDAVRDRAKELSLLEPGANIQELLRRAAELLDQERRAKIIGRAHGRIQIVDPFGRSTYDPSNAPTAKQLAVLAKFKVKGVDGLSRFAASSLLDELVGRARKGLATYAQCQILRRYGMDPENMTIKSASEAIGGIAARGWRR